MSSFKSDCLEGKVAFITGGGTGIGKCISTQLMAHGCDIVIVSRRLDVLQKTAHELESLYRKRCVPIKVDVRNVKSIEAAVDEALSIFGHVDILINAAAGNFLCPIDKMSYNAFRSVMEIDAFGTFYTSKIVYEKCFSRPPHTQRDTHTHTYTHTQKQKQKQFVIINISMTLHYVGALYQAHAGAAKSAIDALTKHMAVEWGVDNVRVNTVAPGPIEGTTGVEKLVYSSSKSEDSKFEDYIPLQRLGKGDDIAYACVYLCLPEASYVTGACVVVDGGQWLTAPNFAVLNDTVRNTWNKKKMKANL